MTSSSISRAVCVGVCVSVLTAGSGLCQGGVVPRTEAAGFSLTTKVFTVDYKVDTDGSLLNSVKKPGGDGAFPVDGQVFPGRFVRSMKGYCHGPRYNGPLAVSLPNGDGALELVYESHRVTQESSNVAYAVVLLRDRQAPVRVELHVRAYRDESVIEQWLVLKNGAGKPLQVKRLDSLYLQGTDSDQMFLEWYESQEGHEAGRPEREKLPKGGRVLESRHGNRHVAGPEPFFCLGFGNYPDEENVPCMVAALSWSGSTRLAFEVHDANTLEVSCGVNQPVTLMLAPGEAVTSPACLYSFSAAGKGPASRNFHRWMRRYGLRDGNRLRLVDNNSWEGCGMEVSEAAVMEMMKISAALGIELYVMDDGWFGNGDNARLRANAGLGDWQLNQKRFPNGLGPLLQTGRESKIALGIWFEPEMVNPRSALFQKHPDWVMRVPGRELDLQRDQAVLDVANPAVQEFIFHSVSDILKANPGIRYVKWDANSSINNPYSPFLGPERQGEMLSQYMAGYYGVLAKLVTAYPEIDFQACAAGGGRADPGALKNSHTFWPSDNTDPGYRLGAIWNFTTCLPPLAATCHVTHSGGKEYQPKYRFDVAMLGQLGMEVDPRKAEPAYLEAARVGIDAYKAVREIVQFGEQYRHRHPYDSSTPSVNYVTQDQGRALILAYQTGEASQPLAFACPVRGLDPLRNYHVAEINLPAGDDRARLAPGVKRVQSGSDWMKQGVPLVFTRRWDSAAVTLEVVP